LSEIDRELELLKKMLSNDDIEEIWINGPGLPVFIWHRKRGMINTGYKLSRDTIITFAKSVASMSGRPLSEEAPLLDASLRTGDRVAIALPPVSPRGPSITIRKFRRKLYSIVELIENGTINDLVGGFLWVAVEGLRVRPLNTLIIGGTASGKTTLLNAICTFIPSNERVITIEDTRELNLSFIPNWEPLEAKPSYTGERGVTMDDLLRHALRKRPNRVIVGEVRGSEATTLLQAMNIGHLGSMGTLHANSAKDAITRLTSPPMSAPFEMIGVLDLIVCLRVWFTRGGTIIRRVSEIYAVGGLGEKKPTMDPIFKYDFTSDKIVMEAYPYLAYEKIGEVLLISPKEIEKEVERRASILRNMVKSGIRSVVDTRRIFERYYEENI